MKNATYQCMVRGEIVQLAGFVSVFCKVKRLKSIVIIEKTEIYPL